MTPPLTVEQLTPAAECRELADHLAVLVRDHAWKCKTCAAGVEALRQFANLQDHARRGITEEVVLDALAAMTRENGTITLDYRRQEVVIADENGMRAALEAIAPHLALVKREDV